MVSRMQWIVGPVLVTSLLACGPGEVEEGDGGGDADADGDTDVDADGDVVGDADGDEDAASGGCAEVLREDVTFEVAPDLPDTQLHPHAIFDGEALWVAFCIPEESGTGRFDIWAVRLGCDGTALTPPFRVNTTTAPNDIDPAVDVNGDRVVIAWQSDTGAGAANMQVFYRAFALDGTPLWDEDRLLVTTRGGETVTGNVMFPAVVALPAGGFGITAARGLDEAGTFQVFLQRFTSAGERDGEAVDGYFEVGVSQTSPSAVATPAGALHLAWSRDDGAGERVVYKVVDDGAAEAAQVAPGSAASGGPQLAIAPAHPDRPLLVFHVENGADLEVRITALGGGGDDRPSLDLGEARRLDHSANIAVGPGGGALAWFRTVRGIRSEVVVQGFRFDGAALEADAELLMDTEDAASPYHTGFAHVTGNVYFVSWSAGTSPDFRLHGRFVTVR